MCKNITIQLLLCNLYKCARTWRYNCYCVTYANAQVLDDTIVTVTYANLQELDDTIVTV